MARTARKRFHASSGNLFSLEVYWAAWHLHIEFPFRVFNKYRRHGRSNQPWLFDTPRKFRAAHRHLVHVLSIPRLNCSATRRFTRQVSYANAIDQYRTCARCSKSRVASVIPLLLSKIGGKGSQRRLKERSCGLLSIMQWYFPIVIIRSNSLSSEAAPRAMCTRVFVYNTRQ